MVDTEQKGNVPEIDRFLPPSVHSARILLDAPLLQHDIHRGRWQADRSRLSHLSSEEASAYRLVLGRVPRRGNAREGVTGFQVTGEPRIKDVLVAV